MKADKRKARLAALLGLEQPKVLTKEELKAKDDVSREMEAVLAYADNPKGFIERECGRCGHKFAVNRANIAYCSDDCRTKSLLDRGILVDLNARTPQERWSAATGGREPLVVPPSALDILSQVQQAEPQPSLPEHQSSSEEDDWLADVLQ